MFLASVTQRRFRLPACRARRLWGFQIYFRALCHPFSIIRSRGPDDARLTESIAAAPLVDEIVQKRNQARQQKEKKRLNGICFRRIQLKRVCMCECEYKTRTTTITVFHLCQRRCRLSNLFEFTIFCCCFYCYFRLVYMYAKILSRSLSLCVSLCYAMQALLAASASNSITDSTIPIAIVCLLSLLSRKTFVRPNQTATDGGQGIPQIFCPC